MEKDLEKRIEALEDDASTLKQKLEKAFGHILHGLNSLSLAIIGVCGVLLYIIWTQKGDGDE